MPQNSDQKNNTKLTPKYFLKQTAKPLTFLLIFIMICAFLVHYLTDSETLLEYADSNPELAYGSTADPPSLETALGESVPNNNKEQAASVPAESDETTDDQETSDDPSAYNTAEETVPDDADDSIDAEEQPPEKEQETMTTNPNRTIYQEGFYYEPLSDEIKQRITGISYPESGCTVPYEDLNYVGVLYIDFNGEIQEGELICNRAIAQDMAEIFYELFQNDYRIERIRLIDEYGGDDTLSMEDNNTSCFNYRVVDGTNNLSKHALGCAIDINPFYNPYVVYNRSGNGDTYISPKGSEVYADRSREFPYKIDENDLCYKLFTAHGFTWGGNWNSSKDYQHFQIVL